MRTMQAVSPVENVTLSVPINDMSLLRSLSKKMGWTMRRGLMM